MELGNVGNGVDGGEGDPGVRRGMVGNLHDPVEEQRCGLVVELVARDDVLRGVPDMRKR